MFRSIIILLVLLATTGCGTTKWTDTARTGTEQLLISYAIDRVVEQIDFSILEGKKVFVKSEAIDQATDNKYISMAIRQQVAICGGLICDEKNESEFIVELRAGAVGTDRNDLLFGIPAFTLPEVSISGNTTGSGTTIPEIPFVKKTDQRAVCKIAVFAYHRETGKPLWCSGNRQNEGRAKAWWVFGAGPINRGNIFEGTEFAGDRMPLVNEEDVGSNKNYLQPLADEHYFFGTASIDKEDNEKDDGKDEKAKEAEVTKEVAEEPKNAPEPAVVPTPATDAPPRVARPSRYGNFY